MIRKISIFLNKYHGILIGISFSCLSFLHWRLGVSFCWGLSFRNTHYLGIIYTLHLFNPPSTFSYSFLSSLSILLMKSFHSISGTRIVIKATFSCFHSPLSMILPFFFSRKSLLKGKLWTLVKMVKLLDCLGSHW